MDNQQKIISDWLGSGAINFFGPPLAGKDTQARLLSEWLKAPIISSGDILRQSVDASGISPVLDAGQLVPSNIYLDLVTPELSKSEYNNLPLILSALGRKHGEEEHIIKACKLANHPIKAAIFINLSPAAIWERFEALGEHDDRGPRGDDNKTSLQKRLKLYHDETLPVKDIYRDHGLLIEIDGAGDREEVGSEIFNSLLERATVV